MQRKQTDSLTVHFFVSRQRLAVVQPRYNMEALRNFPFEHKSIRGPLSVDVISKSHIYSDLGQSTPSPSSSPKSKGMFRLVVYFFLFRCFYILITMCVIKLFICCGWL